MSDELLRELEELRAFKRAHSSFEKAFDKLESALRSPNAYGVDTVMSGRAFRILGECLLELKRRMDDGTDIQR